MKKIALILSAVFILVFLFGCKAEENAPAEDMNKVNEPEVELVTKEQIMEYFDFSDEELEGIDVDAIIKYNQYTEEYLKKDIFTKEYFLWCLKYDDEQMKRDIGYLFKGGQPDGKVQVSQIKTVALLEYVDIDKYYWHIRIQDKKAYYCFGYSENMDLENCATRSGVITDEYISELLSCLEKANLHKWKDYYKGNDEDSIYDLSWLLGIELIDGTVYTWGGQGLHSGNHPEEYQTVKDVIDKSTK